MSLLLLLGTRLNSLVVVLPCIPLVPQKLRIHPFGGSVAVLAWLLDAILVGLEGLVVSGVILRLCHLCDQREGVAAQGFWLAGTGISKRPFTLPKRLPVSEPPFRGQSSRPATSIPYRSFVLPVRISIPLRAPVRPVTRQIVTEIPSPDSRSVLPALLRISTPLWGLSDPSGSKRSTRFLAGKFAFRALPIAYYSLASILFY
jgi:hypothetical protein